MPHSNRVANVRGWESRGRDGTLRSRYDSLKTKRDGQTDRQRDLQSQRQYGHRRHFTEPSKRRDPEKGLDGKNKEVFLSPVFESCAFSTTFKVIFCY